jgi:hypothetical protein
MSSVKNMLTDIYLIFILTDIYLVNRQRKLLIFT